MIFYIVLFLFVVTFLFLYIKLKKPAPDLTGGPTANDNAKPKVTAPGKGKPMFAGIRVLELCEVVASPICCRILADMGADVIKVEKPGRGDLARTLLAKEFEKDRPWSSGYDQVNTSKRSIVLNLKKKSGLEKFFKLLEGADIFVCNTRHEALKKLGLTYADVHKKYPHIIYAHLSAYGTTGPDASSPGLDTTAFWVNTGLSATIHRPGLYSLYPAGFGDVVAGSLLYSGICMALKAKNETGIGLKVSNSLFQAGLYVQAPTLSQPHKPEIKGALEYTPAGTEQSPLYGSYPVKNQRFIYIGVLDKREETLTNLEKVIPGVVGKKGVDLYRVISEKLARMEIDEAVKQLRSVGVPCEPSTNSFLSPITTEKDHPDWTSAKAWINSFVKDNDRCANIPFDCGDTEIHTARCRAPYLGQHTEDVIDNGWVERDASGVLPSLTANDGQDPVDIYGKKLLSGITIVELSDIGVAASSCCQMAADFGARVLKVEPKDGDFWREENPRFFNTMNRGKSSVVHTGDEDLLKLLSEADAFVTNRPVTELKDRGLDRDSLREKFPNLIYCHSSPRGYEGGEDNRADNLVWFGEANLNCFMEPVPPGFPLQMGELMTGCHLFAGLSTAIFHKQRCGAAEFVETNLKRSALYGSLFLNSFCSRNHQWADFLTQDPRDIDMMRNHFSLFSFYTYKTKDNVWIQVIGIDIAGDGKKLISVLGLWPTILKAIPKVLFGMITAKGSLFLKLRELGKVLIPIFDKVIGSYTFEELTALFDEKDVWWCKVMTHDQMAHHRQVKFLDLLPEYEGGHQVATPLNIGSDEKDLGLQKGKVPAAPRLGEILS